MIEAFNKLKHPYKRLHIVGADTVDKPFFEKKIRAENIIIYGHVSHLKLNNIINKCHVFVLPSIQEGLAMVTLQALSGGCPVIVSENTGAKELVKKNKCGMLFQSEAQTQY